jgi:hypothetical protein
MFHGWVEHLTLLLILFIVLSGWGWARNRGLRPAERAENTPWNLMLATFGLVLVIRAVGSEPVLTGVLALAVLLAGWMGRNARTEALWIPGVLLGALMGTGHMLSAIVLAAVGFIVLLISAKRP